MNGQAYKVCCPVIRTNDSEQITPVDKQVELLERCCFNLPVFADPSNPDDKTRNDFNRFMWSFNEFSTGVKIFLVRCGEDVQELDNNDFGTFYEWGFHCYEDQKSIGYHIEWWKILDVFGEEGEYSLRVEGNSILGGAINKETFTYNLQRYVAYKADQSVRLDFTNNGSIGDWRNDRKRKDFSGLNWVDSIRIPESIFFRETASYETKVVHYNTGQKEFSKNEQNPEFQLEIRALPVQVHSFLKTEVFQSDYIELTDYNSNNPLQDVVCKAVYLTSSYEPDYEAYLSTAPVNLTLEPVFNNLRKQYC